MEIEFDIENYLNSLLEAMGTAEAGTAVEAAIAEQLAKQVAQLITRTLAENIDDAAWDELFTKNPDAEMKDVLEAAVQKHPAIKDKLVSALDAFWDETLEAYASFK